MFYLGLTSLDMAARLLTRLKSWFVYRCFEILIKLKIIPWILNIARLYLAVMEEVKLFRGQIVSPCFWGCINSTRLTLKLGQSVYWLPTRTSFFNHILHHLWHQNASIILCHQPLLNELNLVAFNVLSHHEITDKLSLNYHIQIWSRFKVISGISKNRAARHESYPVRQSPPCHNFMVSLTLYLVKRLQLLYSCYFYVCIKKYRYNHFLTCTASKNCN